MRQAVKNSRKKNNKVMESPKEVLYRALTYGIINNIITSNRDVAVSNAVGLLASYNPEDILYGLKSTSNKLHARNVTRIGAILYIQNNKEFEHALAKEIKSSDDLYILMLVDLHKKKKINYRKRRLIHRVIEKLVTYYDIYRQPKKVQQIVTYFRYRPRFRDKEAKQMYMAVIGNQLNNPLYRTSITIGKQLINQEGLNDEIIEQINRYKIPYELIRKYLYMLNKDEEKQVLLESIKYSSEKHLEEIMKYSVMSQDREIKNSIKKRSESLKLKGIQVNIDTEPLQIDLGDYPVLLDCTAKMQKVFKNFRFNGTNIKYLPNRESYIKYCSSNIDNENALYKAADHVNKINSNVLDEMPDSINIESLNSLNNGSELLIITNGYQNTLDIEKKVKKMKNVKVTIWVLDDLVSVQKFKGIYYVFGTTPECIKFITMLTNKTKELVS